MSDKFGRIRPLLLSLALLFIASIGCALAKDIHALLVARLFEGLAGAGGAVLSRAIARDMYSGHELTRFCPADAGEWRRRLVRRCWAVR